MEYRIKEINLLLLPQKAAFMTEQHTLLIADLHFGKINHFRRSGIAVPAQVNNKNLEILIDLLRKIEPKTVVFMGDLFHSHYNEEWEALKQVTLHFSGIDFKLVKGNHDIMSDLQYTRCKLDVHDQLEIGSVILTHEPLDQVPHGRYNISGHIHPGVKLYGKGRQSMTLPCFHFGEHRALLPAFGSFTGYVKVPVSKADTVFIITGEKVIEMNHE